MVPPLLSRFETGASTHPGTQQRENQDACLAGTPAGLWAVADGMGGHDAGHYASHAMIDALRTIMPQASAAQLLRACEACVVDVNNELMRVAAETGTVIGTTLAALLTHDVHYACVWAGDSRIYLVQKDGIALVSRDHTEVQDLVERGLLTEQEGRTSPGRHILTRAIGVSSELELEIAQGVLRHGDTFLLCSDGLTNYVTDAELHATLPGRTPQDACRALVDLAIGRGGVDNVTVVVVRYYFHCEPTSGATTILDPNPF
ncbi:PP2C family protein-serine/threonine phosphatase [Lichenifustis flavocetrariae]|uniref:Protein phosphatase 2C domain-containing protein n=1 Tax=Lichenifustis flavocetrariae TaxID=2949735 RepID=A0AA42CKU8_9HYPH|nr:protein phosphatase 2C domain-containing protein [Lichenifustis flavocetrariae]MCW6506722.1 protein phosphatase 2C domain-containing protein [Lichenifustis flavocetrariae]